MELNLTQIASIATTYNQGRTDWDLSTVSFYANIAVQEVAVRAEYRGLERIAYSSTTSGENRVSLPTDFDYMLTLSLSSLSGGLPWQPVRITDPQGIESYGTTVGQPQVFAVYSDWLELWPPPDSSYSVQMRYGAKISVMTDSASTPGLDSRYHYPIALKTAELLAASRNDVDQEAQNRVRFLDAISSIPNDAALRQRTKDGMNARVLRR